MKVHWWLCFLSALFVGISAFAQQSVKPPSAPGTPTTPNNPPNLGTTQPNNQPGNSPADQLQMPVYLSGRVMMEDGTAPPDAAQIQLICRGTPRGIALTDSKGNFHADLTNPSNNLMFGDASQGFGTFGIPTSGPMATNQQQTNTAGAGVRGRDFMGCDLQVSLAGFRSDVITLSQRRELDNPDVGTFILHRIAGVEGLTISATSGLAPKEARKAFEKAQIAEKNRKWAEAEKELEKAVALYPKYAAAWCELGNVRGARNDLGLARASFLQSIASDPKFVNPYLRLAQLSISERKWQEAEDQANRVIRLNPIDFPQAFLWNAYANYQLRKFDVAEKSARDGLSRDAGHRFPQLSHLLGLILQQKSDLSGSVENLRDYLRYAPDADDAVQVRKQLLELEAVLEPEAKKQ
jgi:tetratricopeptide (TPR) repeat protein